MSEKYVPGGNVCEHGRLRRQCSDCEVTELYKEIGEKDALIESQAKEIERLKQEYYELEEQADRWREESGN